MQEPNLNEPLARVMREMTAGWNWSIQAEATNTFVNARAKKPDVVIRRTDGSPILIENKYAHGTDLKTACLERMGLTVRNPKGGDGTVSIVFGLRSPSEMSDLTTSEEIEEFLRGREELEYVVYTQRNGNPVRFPMDGYIKGDLRAFVDFIKPAIVPNDEVSRAARALSDCADAVANVLVEHDRSDKVDAPADGDTTEVSTEESDAETRGFGAQLGEMLRQPWPLHRTYGSSSDEIRQWRADKSARHQTASMCAVILINALAFQQNLSSLSVGVNDISTSMRLARVTRLTQSLALDEWARILEINYWPIFHIARELLQAIPHLPAGVALEKARHTAESIESAMKWHDVAGIVFQRMIADRKTLKTHYTLPASTILLAHLGVPVDFDWSDPDSVKRYHIADYACGTGGLLLAAYRRVRELHQRAGGSPDNLHPFMMKESLTACDVMPAAVHLTSSLLSSAAPKIAFTGTRSVLFPYGVRKHPRGDDEVNIGSLELLGLKSKFTQPALPMSGQQVMGGEGATKPIEVDLVPESVDLVIMNPPFTRPTKSTRRPEESVTPTNPAFTAFGISPAEQKQMSAKVRKLSNRTVSDSNAGFASSFVAIADNMVRPGGRIALVLPFAAMMGGTQDLKSGNAITWQKTRNLLQSNYDELIVVSVAQPNAKDAVFSADSSTPDCMVIGTKAKSPVQRNQVHFVNLVARPSTNLEAHEVARAIRAGISATTAVGTQSAIRVGKDDVGFVALEDFSPNSRLAAVRVRDAELFKRVQLLREGVLRLPKSLEPLMIPMTRADDCTTLGPLHKDIASDGKRGPFKLAIGHDDVADYPALWNHEQGDEDRHRQNRMLTITDAKLVPKKGREDEANAMWQRYATHLHITQFFTFNANPTCSAWTAEKSLGGGAWPTIRGSNEDEEKALCVWLNSTLGMMLYWYESNRTQDGRGIISITARRNLPLLDVKSLDEPRIAAATDIFDDLIECVMLPAHQATRDDIRQELDLRLLTDVLGADGEVVDQFANLRRRWCSEPSVTGRKT